MKMDDETRETTEITKALVEVAMKHRLWESGSLPPPRQYHERPIALVRMATADQEAIDAATNYRDGDDRATKAAKTADPEAAPATPHPSVLDHTDEQLIKWLDGK